MKHSLLILGSFLIFTTPAVQAASEYQGSSFQEVLEVLENKNFQPQSEIEEKELQAYDNRQLPHYAMNMQSIFGRGSAQLTRDAQRTLNQKFDYYDRIEKLLHPNGVCMSGQWTITRNTPYSGYFKKGARGLFIGRASVAMQNTTSDDKRGFGFAGKLFPTMNPEQVVKTANFFSVDVLMGTHAKRFLDVGLTNEPALGFSFNLIALGLKIAKVLGAVEENPMFRPITQIAALDETGPVKSPKWIRIIPAAGNIKNTQKDFRYELMQAVAQNPILKFNVDVSETTSDREATSGWTTVGQIEFDQAFVSYGCDRRLHFAHPKLK